MNTDSSNETDRAVQPEAPTLQEQIEWATSEYNTAVANGLIGRARIIGRRLDALEARAASQERPQPPLHAHQVSGDWYECTDEHPGVAQERPPIDAPLNIETLGAAYRAARRRAGAFDELDELRQGKMIRDEYARLAGGSVASPEPPE
jgi:hypothetical protein